ncbi:MAG: serine O-acetyltransferase [Pseudonocardiales bacterium]|nr:serine O-acetyltransferase [Pseudonocardiales bacterium]
MPANFSLNAADAARHSVRGDHHSARVRAVPPAGEESTPSFRELVFSDFARYRANTAPSWPRVLARCLFLPGLVACILLRAQQKLFDARQVRLAYLLRTIGVVLFSADFVPGMRIGRGLYLPHPMGVTMGGGLRVGENVTILQGVTFGTRHPDGSVAQEFATIGDGAIICTNAVLVGGVRVGDNAQVGANSVVLSDVADNAVVLGVPARQVGTREDTSFA